MVLVIESMTRGEGARHCRLSAIQLLISVARGKLDGVRIGGHTVRVMEGVIEG